MILPRLRPRPLRSPSRGRSSTLGAALRVSPLVAPAVLVRRVLAALVEAPHQVVVGIERVVAGHAAADFQIARRRIAAVDEMMRIAPARRIAGAIARAQQLLAI